MSSEPGRDSRRETISDGHGSWRDGGEPVVGRTIRPTNVLAIIGAFAALAITLFLFLESRRTQETASLVTPIASPSSGAPLPPPPLEVPRPLPPVPTQEVPVANPTPVPVTVTSPPTPATDPSTSLRAPAVVVDLQGPNSRPGLTPTQTNGAAGTNTASGKSAAGSGTTIPDAVAAISAAGATGSAAAAGSTEQFAAHASETLPPPAVATQLTNLSTTITQGATIPGIMETALNSDLPGYTRAIVSRDVRAFDGKAVLIPRGSSLIGQYRNAVSLGQSRVFVIWTRVIRPDGVSIQIGSPGGDALGRGGLTGDVNTHFFARFGGAILLSVLSAGTAAVAGTPSTQVTIGSPAAAVGAAASATIPTGSDIPPTIKVMQGVPITIFVARDLDFTGVKPVQ